MRFAAYALILTVANVIWFAGTSAYAIAQQAFGF